jgi:hypothetical protein
MTESSVKPTPGADATRLAKSLITHHFSRHSSLQFWPTALNHADGADLDAEGITAEFRHEVELIDFSGRLDIFV